MNIDELIAKIILEDFSLWREYEVPYYINPTKDIIIDEKKEKISKDPDKIRKNCKEAGIVRNGKESIEAIIKLYELLDAKKSTELSYKDFRTIQENNFIGIDCSGFVCQALVKIMKEFNSCIPEENINAWEELKYKTLGNNTSKIVGFESDRILRKNAVILSKNGSEEIKNLTQLMPGDVILKNYNIKDKQFHIYIVCSKPVPKTDENGDTKLVFEILDSTSKNKFGVKKSECILSYSEKIAVGDEKYNVVSFKPEKLVNKDEIITATYQLKKGQFVKKDGDVIFFRRPVFIKFLADLKDYLNLLKC